jgi:D-arabinose 1-dehydrogenase-like Zn-dependent alcohol dehydrogenase
MVQRIPADMGFVTAASLQMVYGTAHFALSHIARLRKGESPFVHSAAGGVGQAAIVLAQHMLDLLDFDVPTAAAVIAEVADPAAPGGCETS